MRENTDHNYDNQVSIVKMVFTIIALLYCLICYYSY